MIEFLFSALLLGLAGSLHCVGMCGAIVTAFSMNSKNKSFTAQFVSSLMNNLGRISTYIILGVIAGVISSVSSSLGFLTGLRIIAALILIMVGVNLILNQKGFSWIESFGAKIWQHIKPMATAINPAKSNFHSYISGLLWGLIPCGLVYSAVTAATASGDITYSVLFMALFGFGTLLPLLAMGIGFSHLAYWMKKPWVKNSLAVLLIGFGSWSLYSLTQHSGHNMNESSEPNHQHHQHH